MKAIPPRPDFDWSGDERAELRRLEQLCDASQDWSLECSHRMRVTPGASSTISTSRVSSSLPECGISLADSPTLRDQTPRADQFR